MPDAARQQLIDKLVGYIYDNELCRLNEQVTSQLLASPDFLVAVRFHKPQTNLRMIVAATCAVTAFKKDVLRNKMVQNEDIDDLVITVIQNHEDTSISIVDAVRQAFQGAERHRWWLQSSFFSSMTACLSKVHASHA
ncbi:hypothetical protein RF11_07627 [Thelohanellus kitauei]|uniref:Uncharacterized protein n=1 Tax=Thelohanellus kitauei TaxID=669202 RepID=A0A0C2JZW2_THEKT|nr:hypothetical protein RF11_07627 [Thelohanellus kitauei]